MRYAASRWSSFTVHTESNGLSGEDSEGGKFTGLWASEPIGDTWQEWAFSGVTLLSEG